MAGAPTESRKQLGHNQLNLGLLALIVQADWQ